MMLVVGLALLIHVLPTSATFFGACPCRPCPVECPVQSCAPTPACRCPSSAASSAGSYYLPPRPRPLINNVLLPNQQKFAGFYDHYYNKPPLTPGDQQGGPVYQVNTDIDTQDHIYEPAADANHNNGPDDFSPYSSPLSTDFTPTIPTTTIGNGQFVAEQSAREAVYKGHFEPDYEEALIAEGTSTPFDSHSTTTPPESQYSAEDLTQPNDYTGSSTSSTTSFPYVEETTSAMAYDAHSFAPTSTTEANAFSPPEPQTTTHESRNEYDQHLTSTHPPKPIVDHNALYDATTRAETTVKSSGYNSGALESEAQKPADDSANHEPSSFVNPATAYHGAEVQAVSSSGHKNCSTVLASKPASTSTSTPTPPTTTPAWRPSSPSAPGVIPPDYDHAQVGFANSPEASTMNAAEYDEYVDTNFFEIVKPNVGTAREKRSMTFDCNDHSLQEMVKKMGGQPDLLKQLNGGVLKMAERKLSLVCAATPISALDPDLKLCRTLRNQDFCLLLQTN